MKALKLIKKEEGWSATPYLCSEGYPTIGYGFKIGPRGADLGSYTFSITKEVGEAWMLGIARSLHDRLLEFSWYQVCGEDRQAVLMSMAYQLGFSGLLKFRKMLSACSRYDWDEAYKEALDSKWAQQTPERAMRHAMALKTGHLDSV